MTISDLRPTENTGDNLTGGYLMKIDKTTGSPSKNWSSNFGSGLSSKKSIIQVEYPKYDSLSNSQYSYIKNYMDTFEKSLHDDSPSNPKSTYKSMINLPSFPVSLCFGDADMKTLYIVSYSKVYKLRTNMEGYVNYL